MRRGATLLAISLAACAARGAPAEEAAKPERKPNRLAREKSPYLLQHAHNPVDWFPWGPEAFEKARLENKPVFLSIGYSTCHWCHVMERESFENEKIAAYLNEHFVAIKVDREERPDVDAVYMAACQAQNGSGGWPLSAFITPDGKPFFTGTYFPPGDDPLRGMGFLSILEKITEGWRTQKDSITTQADRFAEHLRKEGSALAGSAPLKLETLRAAFATLRDSYDDAQGGFGGAPRYAPKFPRTSTLDFLLRYAALEPIKKEAEAKTAVEMVRGTLDAMLRGGIRDHVGGGFHRYSTDRRWLIPHFEKMLYDQALITRTLCDAWRVTGDPAYSAAARETMDYVLGRLRGPEGELWSAEDADTQGAEGKTYTWRRSEVIELLGKERGERLADFYGCLEEGNFDEGGKGASVLHVALEGGAPALARSLGRPLAEVEAELAEGRAKLLAARAKRPQPFLDDKVLVEWNGFAISALAHVYEVTGEARYLAAARAAADFILKRATRDGRLLRRFRAGDAAVDGFLEDHAAFVGGLLDLHESSFESRWLEEAVRLGREMVARFWDEKDGGFFSSGSAHEALVARPKEFYDGAVPSGNSVAFLDLLRLEELTGDEAFGKPARALEKVAGALLERSAESHPVLLCAAAWVLGGAREVVVAGPAGDPVADAMTREAWRRFVPARVLLRVESAEAAARLAKLVPLVEGKGPIAGKAAAFVCTRGVCKLPARDVASLLLSLGF